MGELGWPHELKLQRASEHLGKLESEIRRWEQGAGYSLRVEPGHRVPNYVLWAEMLDPIGEVPFSLILGDFLQNARASLDYAATALGDAGAEGGVMAEDAARETMFPIVGGTGDYLGQTYKGGHPGFKKAAKRRLPTVSDDAIEAIESLQPYKAQIWPTEPLWILNELARYDRHRFLQLGVATASGGLALNEDRSANVRIANLEVEAGPLSSLEGDAWEDAQYEAAVRGDLDVRDPRGAVLARFRAEPIDPSKEMKVDFDAAIDIVFNEDRLPDTLALYLDAPIVWYLQDIVPAIEDAFRTLAPFLPDEPPDW